MVAVRAATSSCCCSPISIEAPDRCRAPMPRCSWRSRWPAGARGARGAVPLNGTEFIATGSVGISLFPQDALDAEALMKNADSAMYQSKRQERAATWCSRRAARTRWRSSAHDAPASRRRAGGLGPALPAGREPRRRFGRGRRGPRAMAGTQRRHPAPRRVHPVGRGARAHRGDRRLGDRRDGVTAARVGRRRARPVGRLQPLAAPALVGPPGRQGHRGSCEPPTSTPREDRRRDHRVHRDGRPRPDPGSCRNCTWGLSLAIDGFHRLLVARALGTCLWTSSRSTGRSSATCTATPASPAWCGR